MSWLSRILGGMSIESPPAYYEQAQGPEITLRGTHDRNAAIVKMCKDSSWVRDNKYEPANPLTVEQKLFLVDVREKAQKHKEYWDAGFTLPLPNRWNL